MLFMRPANQNHNDQTVPAVRSDARGSLDKLLTQVDTITKKVECLECRRRVSVKNGIVQKHLIKRGKRNRSKKTRAPYCGQSLQRYVSMNPTKIRINR
jgi:hypothetical protein